MPGLVAKAVLCLGLIKIKSNQIKKIKQNNFTLYSATEFELGTEESWQTVQCCCRKLDVILNMASMLCSMFTNRPGTQHLPSSQMEEKGEAEKERA